MNRDVIIACDFSSWEQTKRFLELFTDEKPFIKIGMELFYSEGPHIIREAKAREHKIFLDLKLHDIPNTVKKAMQSLSKLDIDMCNVHASTIEMMRAAVEGLTNTDGKRPLLVAVTQLTSTDERALHDELLIEKSIEETVLFYAKNAKKAGLDGTVCSPHEAAKIKQACGQRFLTVTPGIRFEGGEKGDQKRVTTPAEAKKCGSDYIVIGRPITQAVNPVFAYRQAISDFLGGGLTE